MARIEIDYKSDEDDCWAHFIFKQEGSAGFILPEAYLGDFLEALESSEKNGMICFYQNYFVEYKNKSYRISISTKPVVLLQLDDGQCAKLVSHLKTTYSTQISVYR